MQASELIPTEAEEMAVVCEWLDLHGVRYFHPQNEGQHKVQYRAKMARLGVKAGVPDLMIVDKPPVGSGIGLAIELKRRKGGAVSAEQRAWLADLEQRGWAVAICRGAEHAIELLTGLGYGRRSA